MTGVVCFCPCVMAAARIHGFLHLPRIAFSKRITSLYRARWGYHIVIRIYETPGRQARGANGRTECTVVIVTNSGYRCYRGETVSMCNGSVGISPCASAAEAESCQKY